MKNLNFKQGISEILSLKSKSLTLLLGTFVPFFVCHVIACATSSKKEGDLELRKSEEKIYYPLHLLLIVFPFIVYYIAEFFCVGYILTDNDSFLSYKWLVISFYLCVVVATHFALTFVYFTRYIYQEQE